MFCPVKRTPSENDLVFCRGGFVGLPSQVVVSEY